MTKRRTKAQSESVGLVIFFAVLILGIGKIFGAACFLVPLGICVAGFSAFVWHKRNQEKMRSKYLRCKYSDERVAERVVAGRRWEGQTSQQLIDSLGNPQSIEQKVLKTRKREIWKYDKRGANRYGLRVTLEDDIVVGWEEKPK